MDSSSSSIVQEDGKNERLSLLQREKRPRRLRLPPSSSSHYLAEPSPITPCSVFSFELPNSPAVLSSKPRMSRTVSADQPTTPSTVFNFDFLYTIPLEFGSQKTLRSISVPATPKSPCVKSPAFLTLPTIEEARGSFSSEVQKERIDTSESLIEEKQTDWTSIRLIMIVIFFTRIQFTVYFASLFPFMKQIDSNSTDYFYSFISVTYSVGLAAAAPFFGKWANKLGCIRRPSIFSMILMLITNVMYLLFHLCPFEARWAMLVARLLAGIAAGGNALLPTYWTYAAAEQDRSTAAAMFDGAFCLGLAFGPGFQLLFSRFEYPGPSFLGLQFNLYTLPAMVSVLLISSTLFLMIFKFNEVPMPKKEKRSSIDSAASSDSSAPLLPPFDKLAVSICILGKMVQMFVYACMETIGSMYTQRMFGLSLPETTSFNSLLVSLSGLLGFLFLMTYVWTKTGKKVDNRHGVLIGVFVCIGFVLTTYPWNVYTDKIAAEGCDETEMSWCLTTPRIPQLLYSVSYVVVFGVGFALMNVHLAAMYCSVLGPRRQGTMHGINTLLASSSRVLGPLAITDMYKMLGPRVVWLFQLSTWCVLVVLLVVFYRRLVPCVQLRPIAIVEQQETKPHLEDSSK